MAKNFGVPKTSPSLGSGKAAAARTPFRGLRTVNPQSNFSSRITKLRALNAGGRVSAKIPRY
jgi:hypothetical protein